LNRDKRLGIFPCEEEELTKKIALLGKTLLYIFFNSWGSVSSNPPPHSPNHKIKGLISLVKEK